MAIEHAGEYSEMTGGKLPMPVVLVVDDEALIRWSVSEGLMEVGYVVKQAATGAEAREVVATTHDEPLVVVLDLRLPDVADLSLLKDIRTERPEVPVVMMTAHGTSEDARQATRLGVFRFLTKPFDVHVLVDLVGEAWAAAR